MNRAINTQQPRLSKSHMENFKYFLNYASRYLARGNPRKEKIETPAKHPLPDKIKALLALRPAQSRSFRGFVTLGPNLDVAVSLSRDDVLIMHIQAFPTILKSLINVAADFGIKTIEIHGSWGHIYLPLLR